MYKMIVLDMDGTLLNSQKQISCRNKEILLKAKREAKIVLASARGFYRIKPYLGELNLLNSDNYTIAFNGSSIVRNDGTVLVDHSIKAEDIRLLEDFIRKQQNLDWYFYYDQGRIKYRNAGDILSFACEHKIYKVVALGNREAILQSRKIIPQTLADHLMITSSEDEKMEMVAKGMDKAAAVRYLTKILGIKKEEIIAMGDGENDLAMLKTAEVGVAMENAQPLLKAAADYVSDSNDRDGVGKALIMLMNLVENNEV